MRTEKTQSLGSITANVLKLNGLHSKKANQEKETEAQEFIHPIFTKADFAKTIANYNKHITIYNKEVDQLNKEVNTYNKGVILNRRGLKPDTEQKVREQIWKHQHKDLAPEEYNQAVEKYNYKNGLQFRKKPLRQPVKPETEKYFVAFLHHYNGQLFKRKENFKKLGVFCPAELPQFDLYPNKVAESEREGCKTLPVCKDAIRHHRDRLEESGVITQVKFRGPNRAVKITFNADILAITDNETSKKRSAENQAVSKKIDDNVQYNNVSSRKNSLDKSKIRDKGDVANAPSDNNCTKELYKKTQRQEAEKKFAGGKKIEISSQKNELSHALACALEEKATLARELSAQKHEKYKPIAQEILQQEAFYGTLHPEDFKELVLQDILKFSNSIFKDLNAHPGTWVNAYKIMLKSEKFRNFNGQTLSKPNLLKRWIKCILVLKEVKKFKKNHPEWQPHYPSIYFDPLRKFKENNCFEYAYQFFRLEEPEAETEQQRRIKAKKSLRKKTDVKKAIEKIRLFMRNKMKLDEVYDYVQQNCHPQVYADLDQIIKKEFKQHFNTEL